MPKKSSEIIEEGKLERILNKNKALAWIFETIEEEKQEEIKTSIDSIMQGYELPEHRIMDLLCLHLYLPDNVEEVLELSKKIEEIANQQGLNFKDVVMLAIAEKGIPLGYGKTCSDFAYLIDGIRIVGGIECIQKNNYYLKLIKGEKLCDRDLCQHVIIYHGLEGMEKFLQKNFSEDDEVYEVITNSSEQKYGRTRFSKLRK